jgi:hypothetical protein
MDIFTFYDKVDPFLTSPKIVFSSLPLITISGYSLFEKESKVISYIPNTCTKQLSKDYRLKLEEFLKPHEAELQNRLLPSSKTLIQGHNLLLLDHLFPSV